MPSTPVTTLGIDLANASFDATLRLPDGRYHHHVFPNTADGHRALLAWVAPRVTTPIHACMEATNTYWEALALVLIQQGHTVSVVNPARIKGYAQTELQRNKTDKLDSALIADFCARHTPAPWTPLPPEHRQLRTLVRHRDDLVQTRMQLEQRQRESPDAFVRESFAACITTVRTQIASVEAELETLAAAHPQLAADLGLVTSIVGIGLITATKVLSELAPISSYTDAKAVATDAGVTPTTYESGTSVRRRSRMSKHGKAPLRSGLYMAALTCMRWCPGCQTFVDKLTTRGKPKKVIICAVMRKLLHIVYGVLKHRTPYDPEKAWGKPATEGTI